MFIKPTKLAADLPDEVLEEALLYATNEDVPCPWDAVIELDGTNVIISGGLMAGGPAKGTCVCTFPIEDFTKYYKLEVPDNTDLDEIGWEKI